MDENLIRENDDARCGIEIQRDYNEIFRNSYQNHQVLFRRQLDNLVMPTMCYMCQECYVGIKVKHIEEGPMCSRCQQEKGNNRFSTDNNIDPGSQPPELADLTQVEEMLIARVSPILQVTHAVGGQYKYKGHTICFPQNIEHVYQSLPCPIKDMPIIIVKKKDQHGTN